MTCRFCGHAADHLFVDLGMSPLCESFLTRGAVEPDGAVLSAAGARLSRLLPGAAGRVRQPGGTSSASTPTSRRTRAAGSSTRGSTRRTMRRRLDLTEKSLVIEIASNDGYLLQHFVKAGIPVLGIEPAANVAEVAREKQVPTRSCFFGTDTARELAAQGEQADLLRRQQRAGARSRSERLRGRDEDRAQADRRDHDGVSSPDAADGGEPVRHHLSRALLVFLVSHRGEGLRGARPDAVRRRGDPDARRIAADLRAARRGSMSRPVGPAVAELQVT